MQYYKKVLCSQPNDLESAKHHNKKLSEIRPIEYAGAHATAEEHIHVPNNVFANDLSSQCAASMSYRWLELYGMLISISLCGCIHPTNGLGRCELRMLF